MNDNCCCYVTAFFDIGRSNWNHFNKSFEDYLSHFRPFLSLFSIEKNKNYDEMIVFIDEKYFLILQKLIIENKSLIKLIPINIHFLEENIYSWKQIHRERLIMDSPYFKKMIDHRKKFPECNFAEYTIINHSKIDFICYVIEKNLSKKTIFSWVDFGFFSKIENIPTNLLDVTKFNLDRINYSLINPINAIDFDINFTLKYAPEKIGGFFFLGTKFKMIEYQKLYHKVLHFFQYIVCFCDDDQHLVLQCYYRNPNLFNLITNPLGWHKILKAFQKN